MNSSPRPAAWVLGVLIAVVLVIGTAVSLFRKAPSYGGRGVESWAKLLWAGTPTEQATATKAFQSLGTNAIPKLAVMLRKRDGILRTRLLDLLEKQTLIRYPYMDRDIDQQRIALKAIEVLGESARPLLPVLQDIIRDWRKESVDIVQGAGRIGRVLAPESTPELVIGSGPPHLTYPVARADKP